MRSIKFPSDRSMGELYLFSPGVKLDLDEYIEARGEVNVPLEGNVKLIVSDAAATDLTPLSNLAADDLQVISIFCLRLDEAQLQHIRHLTGLLGLALWETDIGDI